MDASQETQDCPREKLQRKLQSFRKSRLPKQAIDSMHYNRAKQVQDRFKTYIQEQEEEWEKRANPRKCFKCGIPWVGNRLEQEHPPKEHTSCSRWFFYWLNSYYENSAQVLVRRILHLSWLGRAHILCPEYWLWEKWCRFGKGTAIDQELIERYPSFIPEWVKTQFARGDMSLTAWKEVFAKEIELGTLLKGMVMLTPDLQKEILRRCCPLVVD